MLELAQCSPGIIASQVFKSRTDSAIDKVSAQFRLRRGIINRYFYAKHTLHI